VKRRGDFAIARSFWRGDFVTRAVVRFRCGDYADRSCDRDQGGDSERKTSSSHLPFLTTFQSFG
jgi:hypothetical protein